MASQHIAARNNLQLRALNLLLDGHIGQILDRANCALDLLTERIHLVQILAEEFDRNVCLGTRQHSVDTVRDGLTNLDIKTLQYAQSRTYISQKLVARAVGQDVGSLQLRGVNTQRVLVQLGATRLTGYGLHLRNLQQNLLDGATHLVRLFERGAGHCADIDCHRTLVERGQEAATECEEYNQRRHQQCCHTAQNRALVTESPLQCHAIPAFQRASHDRLTLGVSQCALRGEHIATQYGCKGHRHDHRRKERHDERDAERFQHTTLHTVEEEQRHERHDGDDRSIDDRRADLGRGVIDHLEPAATLLFGELIIFAQTSEYVLHVDNRVIDQRSDSDSHTAQTHCIDREVHQFQYENRHQQRQRNSHQRNGRYARVHHKEEEYDHNEQSTFEQCALNVVDRRGDETRLTENIGRDLNVLRQ